MLKDGRFSNYHEFLNALAELDPTTEIRSQFSAIHYDYVFKLKSGRTYRAGDFNFTPSLSVYEVQNLWGDKKIGEPVPCTLDALKKITSEPANTVKYDGPKIGRVITQFDHYQDKHSFAY